MLTVFSSASPDLMPVWTPPEALYPYASAKLDTPGSDVSTVTSHFDILSINLAPDLCLGHQRFGSRLFKSNMGFFMHQRRNRLRCSTWRYLTQIVLCYYHDVMRRHGFLSSIVCLLPAGKVSLKIRNISSKLYECVGLV